MIILKYIKQNKDENKKRLLKIMDMHFNSVKDLINKDKESKTLEEIASTENITKERARKIKERALNRLRNNENSKKLIKYL